MSGHDSNSLTCAQAGPMMAAMLLGELGAEDQRTVRLHLASCGACRRELDEIGRALSFLEENNPLAPAAREELSPDRMAEIIEAAALNDTECNVELMDAAHVPAGGGAGEGLRGALTMRAALERWGIPRPVTGPVGPAFAGLAAAAMIFLALVVSLSWPGREAEAGDRIARGSREYSPLKPIRVVEVAVPAETPRAARPEPSPAPTALAEEIRKAGATGIEETARSPQPERGGETSVGDTHASDSGSGGTSGPKS